jgi:hypothetical protein
MSLVPELHHHATKKEEENRIDEEMRMGGIYFPLVASTCTI